MAARGVLGEERVLVSDRAHLVLPAHFVVDALRERGPNAIGTTKRGIGPAYEDRAARRGVRVIDLADPEGLRAKMAENIEGWRPLIEALGGAVPDAGEATDAYLALAPTILPFVGDVTAALHDAREAGQRVLLEGAQGTMLDLDLGTYPFVTSSSVTAGGACTGTGLAPTHIDRVLGISKAYTTRVGEGPFPTELLGERGDTLRRAGGEFGATTGRPRRCGWLDVPVLRHAARVNGLAEIALTMLDVLTGIDPLPICVAYELDGRVLELPPSIGLERVRPIYEELPGWTEDLGRCRSVEDLPARARRYVRRIEELAGVPVSLLSLGAERTQTIALADPWR
jgi:adenylosuccinate synthase